MNAASEVVCTCATPLYVSTAHLISIDGVLVNNRPQTCVRCYVRGRDAQPARVGSGEQ